MNNIDNSSIIPKYFQLKEILKEKIINGEWKPGEKIPSEKEIVKNCKCSLITVNKAVNKLVEEGYVFRERGRGTFVTPKSMWGKNPNTNITLKLVGMVVPDVTKEFGKTIIRGVEDYLHTRGYNLIIGNHDQDIVKAETYISQLLKKNVSGLIFSPVVGEKYDEKNAKILKLLVKKDVPFVLIDKYIDNINCSYVVTDNIDSSYKLTEKLIEAGHKRIAVLTGMECSSFRDRLKGYKKALEKYGISFDPGLICECDERKIDEDDVSQIIGFLSENNNISAVFAFNSTLARGFILASEKLESKSPVHHISLVSYDNHILPRYDETIFTRISQPEYNMGKKAAQLLVQMIEKGDRKENKVLLKSEILWGSMIEKNKLNN